MAIYNAISIGGTGARCIESLVHLCAAGLGPATLQIFFVDPDKANGNLARTRILIKKYIACRKEIQKSDDKRINPLFKTEIRIPEQDTWNIFDVKGEDTLEKYLKVDTLPQTNQDLLDTLFTREELETNLDVGFRGHPAVGAVVMAKQDDKKDPWRSFWEQIDSVQTAGDAKVFLFGSIFGGTGAAGFPTLSYTMKSDKRNIMGESPDQVSKIKLGGALLLPYFRFNNPTDDEVEDEMYVKVDDFPLAAKAALNYYSEKDLGIDDLYFIGDSTEINVGKFSVGASEQANAAHYIELISALAAIDFFKQEVKEKNSVEPKYFIAGKDDGDKRISWNSIPISRITGDTQSKQKVRAYLTIFAEFTYVMNQYIRKMLEVENSSDDSQRWFQKNFKKLKLDPRNANSKEKLNLFKNYCDDFIKWSTDISNDSGGGNIELFNADKLIADWKKDKFAISQLIAGYKTDKQFSNMINIMNDIIVSNKIMDPANRIVNLAYISSYEFFKINYKDSLEDHM